MTSESQGDLDAADISEAARQLLDGGAVGDESLRLSASIGRALPVREPGGKQHSWFVPITVGDRLAALFQFLTDGTLMRFSSFQRTPGECDSCPEAADWLDPTRIQARAAAQNRSNENPGEAVLTYDRTPDRLVWAVPFLDARNHTRLVYVAGQTVYAPSADDDTFG